jgi:hypothetical protein
MMIIWWSKHVGVILSVLMCDIWINVLLQTSALIWPLYIYYGLSLFELQIYYTVDIIEEQRDKPETPRLQNILMVIRR